MYYRFLSLISCKALLVFFLVCGYLLLFTGSGFCAKVKLAWDQPTDISNIVGYNIYTSPSGASFPDEPIAIIEDPNQTSCSISGLIEGRTYGFVATSFDAQGNESSFSNKVYYTIPYSTQDSDGDGLADADEEYYGLDPHNPDTSGNGLSDAFEVEFWSDAWDGDIDGDGTVNLFDLDADGDGVSDATELIQETNPANGSHSKSRLPSMVFGEVPVDSDWATVELNTDFLNPVVVAGPISLEDQEPAVVRIRNINPQGFEIRLQEYEYQDGRHAQEKASFLVMEMGSYYLPDGTQIEASYFEAKANYPSFDAVFFSSQFAAQPVVMTSIATLNDKGPVTGRMARVSTSSFDYSLQKEEYSIDAHGQESVAYIAWEPSTGELDGIRFVAAQAHDITHNAQHIHFIQNFTSAPSFLACMQTTKGCNTANVRYIQKTAQDVKLKMADEKSLDNEIEHVPEDVGYLALHDTKKEDTYTVSSGDNAANPNEVNDNTGESLTWSPKPGARSER